jgi:hypothetical protein
VSTAADPLAARPGPAPSGLVRDCDGAQVTITPTGALDANGGVELLAALQAELETASRVDIDLRSVSGWTPEGARSLRRARSLAVRLVDGLHFRTGPGAGQEALLVAFADDELD